MGGMTLLGSTYNIVQVYWEMYTRKDGERYPRGMKQTEETYL
jgi:hypothetical protein